MNANSSNRWLIAAAGVVMQLALGAVYAWSVFRIPLTKSYGWTVSQVTLAFELAILMLGFAAFAGGLWMKRSGPRRVAAIGGFGAGALITAPVAQHLISWVGVSQTFTILGFTYFIAVSGSALFMRNPRDDYRPPGWQPPVSQQQQRLDYTLGAALKTWQ